MAWEKCFLEYCQLSDSYLFNTDCCIFRHPQCSTDSTNHGGKIQSCYSSLDNTKTQCKSQEIIIIVDLITKVGIERKGYIVRFFGYPKQKLWIVDLTVHSKQPTRNLYISGAPKTFMDMLKPKRGFKELDWSYICQQNFQEIQFYTLRHMSVTDCYNDYRSVMCAPG